LFTHDARHHGFAARFVFLEQAGVNASTSVGVATVLEDGFDLVFQVLPFCCSLGFWPALPFVVTAFADLEHSQQDLEVEFFAVLVNEFESHLLSLAKKRPSPSARTARQRSRPVRCRCGIKKVLSCEQEGAAVRVKNGLGFVLLVVEFSGHVSLHCGAELFVHKILPTSGVTLTARGDQLEIVRSQREEIGELLRCGIGQEINVLFTVA
jgi:hypothetical protein